jgi:nucleotide-binding universal stress UspA family protein
MTRTYRRKAIVVGVDGSASSHAAIALALEEARRRDLPVRLVHAEEPTPPDSPDGRSQVLDDALAHARRCAPDLNVGGNAATGVPAVVLLAAAAEAELVVVGSRGLGGFRGLLLGSVSSQVSAHAGSPVVVARDSRRYRPPVGVIVGVDGSDGSDAAVEFAFEEAALRGVGLTAVHAFGSLVKASIGDDGMDLRRPPEPRQLAAEESRVLTDSLVGWQQKYPDVEVTARLVRGHPAWALAGESVDGELLVVGTRGRGGFHGLFLGSVSQAVLHHAACPIAVVPRRR